MRQQDDIADTILGAPFPTEAETERYLRTNMSSSFPDNSPINLRTLAGTTARPTIDALIIAAIWGSLNRRLTTQEICDAVQEHFPQLDEGNRKWRNGIKYHLSLKAKYVRQKKPDNEPGPRYGQHWLININMGEGYTRKRTRRNEGEIYEADENVGDYGQDEEEEEGDDHYLGDQDPWTTYDPHNYYVPATNSGSRSGT
ncbi:hypothetical protein CPC08DRAFT_770074 [Agrocybe pediades]|nr:hypothetical protein CPC08DRAFT_770074 [Agrocybe pediades]